VGPCFATDLCRSTRIFETGKRVLVRITTYKRVFTSKDHETKLTLRNDYRVRTKGFNLDLTAVATDPATSSSVVVYCILQYSFVYRHKLLQLKRRNLHVHGNQHRINC
jgi:hypothetical protein